MSSANAFRVAGLRQRVVTAVVIGAFFLATVFWTSLFWFQIVFSIIFLIAAWEWINLAGFNNYRERLTYVLLMFLVATLLQCTTKIIFYPAVLSRQSMAVGFPQAEFLMTIALIFWVIALVCVMTYPGSEKIWGSRIIRALMGFFVILPAWAGIVLLKQQQVAGMLVLCVVFVIALADIGAYFVGVRFGKHKLAPTVSPGKSWEGVVGGMVCNIAFAALLSVYLNVSFVESVLLIFVLVFTSAASIVGDLFESMVKRYRGVKDSGSLLPGHGGVLDRIDGWMAAVPVFTLAYLTSAASN